MNFDVEKFSDLVYVATGNLQHRGTPTRMVGLWMRLHADLSNSTTLVERRPWDNNWKHEAEGIYRVSVDRPNVVLIGYSWGAGHGCIQLAKYLRLYGILVRRMILIDPVYHHWHFVGNWRALVSWSKIHVPSNVLEVYWFRQQVDRPRGHDLIADGEHTKIHDPVIIDAPHVAMDDQPEVIDTSYNLAMGAISNAI